MKHDHRERFHREKEIFDAFCHAQGLHHSDKRTAVLETFLAAEHHLTAEDLCERLHHRHTQIDLKTVQSALELMVDSGLARKLKLESGKNVYEHAFAHRHHDHLICRKCNRMIEFANTQIEKLQDEIAAAHHFVVEDHVLSLYGVCEACAQKIAVPKASDLTQKQRDQLSPLSKLKPGQQGTVGEVLGGPHAAQRMAAMGIRPGKTITKVSAMLLGGPVVVSVDGRQLALGSGMARKIMIDIVK